jgi:hypothetical protein
VAGSRLLDVLTWGHELCADFGYVLGMRDPKQWAKADVPLKRSIINALGGQQSEDYKHFRKLAVEAYIILRKHSTLFLTLLVCMMGSAIDCFSGDYAAKSLDFTLSQVGHSTSY